MMNWVLRYIKKILNFLYYSYYVFFEGVFRTSRSWPVIDSVSFLLSINIGLPFFYIIKLIIKGDMQMLNFSVISNILYLGIIFSIYKVLKKYYSNIHVSIESKYKTDKLWRKMIYGLLPPLIYFLTFYIVIKVYEFCG